MQCFRLMNLPDRVIAFDELPEKLLEGFEMCTADGFPRHWKEWLGKKKRYIKIPPEKDFLTGQVRKFDPIVEEDSYFYLVDWNVQPTVDKWQEVCAYVKSHVDKETRLLDKITDMAVKLAANKSDGVTLEPEDVPVIKIIPELILDKPRAEYVPQGTIDPVSPKVKKEVKDTPQSNLVLTCDAPGCTYEAKGVYAKNSIRFHKQKMHQKEVVKEPVAPV